MTTPADAVAVVDVHAHAILPQVEALVADAPGLGAQRDLDARRNGERSGAVSGAMVRQRWPRLTQVDRRLADMDEAGVDVQIVSPSPSQYHHHADRDLAMLVCAEAARGIAHIVAAAPQRLCGLGLVPQQHPDLMVTALEQAVKVHGLLGVEISSHAPRPDGSRTLELSDEAYEPFWTRAEELSAVVFLHPFGCTLDERLDRHYLSNIVGQPVEQAVALSHLIFGGVLDRHPDLTIIASHGGGYLPTSIGRADHGWHVRPDARSCALAPSTYLRRLYYDSLVHTPKALRALVAAVGADRVLLGSDHPFDMGVDDPVRRLTSAGLPDTDTRLILGETARLLGLTPTGHHLTTTTSAATRRTS